jgi:hypothetical protein
MFAQLCADLPWTQKLSQVWRMHDPQERAASLAVRDGGPAPVRRAVNWYARHGRLRTGDEIAMATDALTAYQADVAAGNDALLVCDTLEMADALNRRVHDQQIPAEAPSITAARGHRLAVGDVIVSRCNEPAIAVVDATDNTTAADPVRNGQRWRVYALDPEQDRIAAKRLDDGARTWFAGDYLHTHVTHGYAVTVHSAQGVTAEATHAVLGEHTSRNLLYVAMTRGRDTNHAYLYERAAGETQHEHAQEPQPGVHLARRGTTRAAARLARAIIANHDGQARTAHHTADRTPDRAQLPQQVQHLLTARDKAVHARRTAHTRWHGGIADAQIEQRQHEQDQHLHRGRDRSHDYGLEL